MDITQIKERLNSPEYSFLRDNKHLGNNVVLLGLGGSYAYGTDVEDSDVDLRGVAINTKREILTGNDFEQVVNESVDTTIYSFNKIINLFCSCNPNTIELLGLKPEHYLYISPIGREILDNKSMFLSKNAVYTFGGYATSQLRRLQNKSSRLVSQSEMEKNILSSIKRVNAEMQEHYSEMSQDALRLYIDKAVTKGFDTEIFMDITLEHYPLRNFKDICNDMSMVIRSYDRIGRRNKDAIGRNKLGKHMMHLVRLYLMCFDILQYGEINTYREKEHDFLMDIRNGKFLDDNGQPIEKFYKIVDGLEKRLLYLKDHTDLPDRVDMNKVNDFKASINEKICFS